MVNQALTFDDEWAEEQAPDSSGFMYYENKDHLWLMLAKKTFQFFTQNVLKKAKREKTALLEVMGVS